MKPEDIKKLVKEETTRQINEQLKKDVYTNFKTPRHVHNGKDAPKIHQADIVAGRNALGSISMEESKRYTLGLTFNPTQMLFFGVATGPGGERVQIASCAKFGPGYYFQPESSDSVTTGGTEQNVIQGGSWLWTDNGVTVFRSRAIEGHLVNIDNVAGDIVARATIPNLSTQASLSYGDGLAPVTNLYGDRSTKGYGNGFVYVDVTLETDWDISATFIVS